MKANFASLNKKVNSHLDSIKKLECQMSQLLAQLESKPQGIFTNDMMVTSEINHDKCLVVLTRSRKVVGGNVKVNVEANTSEKENDAIDVERTDQEPENDTPKSNEGKRGRQGHYEAKMSEKAEDVKGKKGWYSPKPLDESTSGPSAHLKL
uniref:Integrase core domain containing protein n=1 Tax=Solanum tuberosum TaxID=4113 RepID=M1DFE5_SOLTU